MASPRMRRPGGRSKDRGKFYGILVRGGKYIVHIRLPGPERKKTGIKPERKKTWIKMNDLESAQRLVKICSLRIDAFKALPKHHRDRSVHQFQKEDFEESVLQQLEADRNSHQELGIIQRIDMEGIYALGMIGILITVYHASGFRLMPEICLHRRLARIR